MDRVATPALAREYEKLIKIMDRVATPAALALESEKVENRKQEMNPWPKFPVPKQGENTLKPDALDKIISARRSEKEDLKKFQKTKTQCPECSQMFKSPSHAIWVKQVLFFKATVWWPLSTLGI